MANDHMKAFVKYDPKGNIIAGSLITRRNIPEGKGWVEVPFTICCEVVPTTSTTTTTTTTATPSLGTEFSMSDIGYATYNEACAASSTYISYWHDGAGSFPISDDIIYTDPELINPLAGGLFSWKQEVGSVVLTIANNGSVFVSTPC